MKKRTSPKDKSGASRMQQLGYIPVQLWIDPDMMELVRKHARGDYMPVATWIKRLVAKAASEPLPMSIDEIARRAKIEIETGKPYRDEAKATNDRGADDHRTSEDKP